MWEESDFRNFWAKAAAPNSESCPVLWALWRNDGRTYSRGTDITIDRFYKDLQYKVPTTITEYLAMCKTEYYKVTSDGLSQNSKIQNSSWDKCIAHQT